MGEREQGTVEKEGTDGIGWERGNRWKQMGKEETDWTKGTDGKEGIVGK